ncbi:SpoIIE family protein phosphatase [Leptospira sp. 2 VSF19]|uniref:SpoIIE family protein phosphatase n=1 Tax=Leptospira soteropolitanensis TaxID=2950025 RepID=A0AAW5VJL5_9LEPT|nr:SpoIIE family protein phosphatase [Leptospira soteropolitanensis]MCW7494008.1 SpoIIE family protein phosphatase [Leptospira soteropolitanensis]MCW7501726.1 SpoIIE family protein phosphatase [Leptospira soteropolitanensis]MCW7523854.1 SpoIIE family protein phosphatase [Leptospira soteropolitanensis]MCW7527719.1 SpoIIE family protein phosphatase [Leptospira soteropolitanensis]MCW7531696.1 SpoIIE family protein phosphatase [Leptospira soteropolitanensis]
MKRETIFWDLTLKLEAFTHTVPVPFAVYYAIITQKMEPEHWKIFIALCVVFATGIGLLGTFVRHLLVKFVFAKIERIPIATPGVSTLTKEEMDYAKSVKILLFRYPLLEAIIIVIRWLSGVIPISFLFFYLVAYMPSVLRSAIFTFVMITPISFVTYYFISESCIRPLFDLPQIKNIELQEKDIPKFNYFTRILVAFFSLATLPFVIFSYILYSLAMGEIAVQDPMIPIVTVSFIFIIPLIVCSYVVAKSVNEGLNETSGSLGELAKGNFDVVVTPKSSDDFAKQAFYLNSVIGKLKGMYEEIRNLNEGLEEKVKQRTNELNKSLQDISNLKIQQDGDYFLTYQLLNPLAIKDIESNQLEVDHLVRQKKVFEYKNQRYDIGGDINISHSITLQKRRFLLFANADAMGKSMQGAGGALVFGAVFQSIVQRTKSDQGYQALGPEDWLKNNLQEMHMIFEAFDGTMLVSLTMGLLEEDTGKLYFLNAEHPPIVLYRNRKAEYLQADVSYRKLGTLGAAPIQNIKEFQLQPGDVLIIGSDGKDDILHLDTSGKWEVHSDEENFLRMVESTQGNLLAITKQIESLGQIIDDISLIRISYLPKTIP